MLLQLPVELIQYLAQFLDYFCYTRLRNSCHQMRQLLVDTPALVEEAYITSCLVFDFAREKKIKPPYPFTLAIDSVKDPSRDNFDIFKLAVTHADVVALRGLQNKFDIDPSMNANFCIRLTSYYGYSEIVQELLRDPRVDPSGFENECLRFAAMYNHLSTVNVLLSDTRVNPSAKGNEALCKAIQFKFRDLITLLLNDSRTVLTENVFARLVLLRKEDRELYDLIYRHARFDRSGFRQFLVRLRQEVQAGE